MKKIILFAVTAAICLFIPVRVNAEVGPAEFAPEVIYNSPQFDSSVDLSGKATLHFSWQQLPIPSGGRDSYRIVIIKEPAAGVVFDEKIDERTFLIEVPSDVFEAGARYSWHVKQRDARTMSWSRYDIWYFNVIKK